MRGSRALVSAVAWVAAAVLWLPPTPAGAYTVNRVGSYEEAPVTEAYLDHFNGRAPDGVVCAPQVRSVREGEATVYYVDDTSYVPEQAPRTLANAVVLTYGGAGTALNGTALDLTVAMDVTWSHANGDQAGMCPAFLQVPGDADSGLHWLASTRTPSGALPPVSEAGGVRRDVYRNGVSVFNRVSLTRADTGEPFAGRALVWMRDLDQWYGGRFSRESVQLVSGFADDVYVGKNSRLVPASLAQGIFQPVDGSGDDGSRTDFVAYVEGGRAAFRWQGESCSTAFRAIYPATYPPIENDPVYAPEKTVAAVDGVAPEDGLQATAVAGQRVRFRVHQELPYVVEDNKPVMTMLEDVLDDCFDSGSVSVRVFRGDEEVTDDWAVEVVGPIVRVRAKDTLRAVLGLTFEIEADVVPGETGTFLNRATTYVTTRTEKEVCRTTNDVLVEVVEVSPEVRVEKAVRADRVVWSQGTPVFPFRARLTLVDGGVRELLALAVLDPGQAPDGEGWLRATATFDLSAYGALGPRTLEVGEVPVSRFRTASVEGGPCSTVVGDTVEFDLAAAGSDPLWARFTNEKVSDASNGHTAVAVNRVEARGREPEPE